MYNISEFLFTADLKSQNHFFPLDTIKVSNRPANPKEGGNGNQTDKRKRSTKDEPVSSSS